MSRLACAGDESALPEEALCRKGCRRGRFSGNGAIAVLILAMVCLGLLRLHGNRLVFSNDEGIILDAAARMFRGEALYRDFFGYMSPGSYWLQEVAFRLFGVSHQAGRVWVIFDFAVQCALLFWLTARLAGRTAGLAVTVLYFAFQVAQAEFLLAQHRMDSAALSLASIALCLEGERRGRTWCWGVAGVLMACASACTPSIALLAPVTVGWLLADRLLRRFLVPYLGGWSAGLLAMAVALIASGSFMPFIDQMAWLRRNYSGVNVMPYGSIIGGHAAALGGAGGAELVIRSLGVFCLALPAVLPIVSLAVWSLWMSLDRDARHWATQNAIPYLMACMLACVGSTYPRADVAHLAFVAVLPAMLTAVWVTRHAPRLFAVCLFGILAVWAAMFLAQAASRIPSEVAVVTPVGTLQAQPADAAAVSAFLAVVRPHDALYVHPYNPMLYFLSQARNPTRYCYLAPGMMTRSDEVAALDALNSSPPRWLLRLPLTRAEFLRVFPHGKSLDHRFPLIEAWIERDYAPLQPEVVVAGYQLYKHL